MREPKLAIEHLRKSRDLLLDPAIRKEIDAYLDAMCVDPNPDVYWLLREAEDALVARRDSLALERLRRLAGGATSAKAIRAVALHLYNQLHEYDAALDLLHQGLSAPSSRPGLAGCPPVAKDDSLLLAAFCQCSFYEARRAQVQTRDYAKAHMHLVEI